MEKKVNITINGKEVSKKDEDKSAVQVVKDVLKQTLSGVLGGIFGKADGDKKEKKENKEEDKKTDVNGDKETKEEKTTEKDDVLAKIKQLEEENKKLQDLVKELRDKSKNPPKEKQEEKLDNGDEEKELEEEIDDDEEEVELDTEYYSEKPPKKIKKQEDEPIKEEEIQKLSFDEKAVDNGFPDIDLPHEKVELETNDVIKKTIPIQNTQIPNQMVQTPMRQYNNLQQPPRPFPSQLPRPIQSGITQADRDTINNALRQIRGQY